MEGRVLGVCLERLGRITNILRPDRQFPCLGLNPRPPECKQDVTDTTAIYGHPKS